MSKLIHNRCTCKLIIKTLETLCIIQPSHFRSHESEAMDVSVSRWRRRRKAKENSVLTLGVQTACMTQMVIEQVSPFLVFLVEKKLDEFGKIGCPERQGRTDL